jgi:hypothetical protein
MSSAEAVVAVLELLPELPVRTLLQTWSTAPRSVSAGGAGCGRVVEEAAGLLMGGQQGLHRRPQLGLPGAGRLQKGRTLLGDPG